MAPCAHGRPDPFAPLRSFRAALYACFDRLADALFEVADALLASAPPASLPHLSLAPCHRRGWGSLYAALAEGRIATDALRAAVAAVPLAGGQPVYAVDVSVWPRSDAEASLGRRFYYHPSTTRRATPPAS